MWPHPEIHPPLKGLNFLEKIAHFTVTQDIIPNFALCHLASSRRAKGRDTDMTGVIFFPLRTPSDYHRSIATARRFPPPWTIEEHNNACFIVKDAAGQALGYFLLRE